MHSLSDRKSGSLGVEGVEDGLDDDDIRATVYETLGLILVGHHKFVEGYVTERRVLHVLLEYARIRDVGGGGVSGWMMWVAR